MKDRITDAQYRILQSLKKLGGSANLRLIRDDLGLGSKNTVAKHIEKLIRMGYVRRTEALTLHLTDLDE